MRQHRRGRSSSRAEGLLAHGRLAIGDERVHRDTPACGALLRIAEAGVGENIVVEATLAAVEEALADEVDEDQEQECAAAC